jgi:hypothetical protein
VVHLQNGDYIQFERTETKGSGGVCRQRNQYCAGLPKRTELYPKAMTANNFIANCHNS